jgi:hypothetical protein
VVVVIDDRNAAVLAVAMVDAFLRPAPAAMMAASRCSSVIDLDAQAFDLLMMWLAFVRTLLTDQVAIAGIVVLQIDAIRFE